MIPTRPGYWMGKYRGKVCVAEVKVSKGIPWKRGTLYADTCSIILPIDDPDWQWDGPCIWFDRDEIRKSIDEFDKRLPVEFHEFLIHDPQYMAKFKTEVIKAVGLDGHPMAEKIYQAARKDGELVGFCRVWLLLRKYASFVTGVD
jgi:hypothetical protein